MKIALKIGCPKEEELYKWGDYYFARSFGEELKRNGHEYVILLLPDWNSNKDKDCDVVIHFRGLSKYKTKKKHFNIMWNISHPEDIKYKEYEKYDIVLVASNTYSEKLQEKVRVPVYSLLQFVDNTIFYEDYEEKYDSDILFVGNTRGVLRESVKYTIDIGKCISVYGNGWEDFIPTKYIKASWFENDKLRKLYSSTQILLNDHWDDMKEYNFINNRFFDAAACGTVIINDCVDELRTIFNDANIYRTQEEFKNLIINIQDNYQFYKSKAIKLKHEVRNNHSVKRRVEEFLEILEYEYKTKNLYNESTIKIFKEKIFKYRLRVKQKILSLKNKNNYEAHRSRALKRGNNLANAKSVHIGFLITEFEQITNAGDKYAALGIGDWLRKKGYTISYYTRIPEYEWGNISEAVDYIICMTPEADIKYLKKKNKKVIAWIRGNTLNWIKFCNLEALDGVITSSKVLEKQLKFSVVKEKILGVTNLAIPTDIYKALENTKIDYHNRDIDVSFIGNITGQKRYIVDNLELSNNINFYFYGTLDEKHEWNKYYHGSIEHDKVKDVYLNSKIVIEDIAPLNRGTVNLRIFEAAACGALVIANDDIALYELFNKNEIVVYRDKDELNDKIEYYLKNDDERIKKARKLQDIVFNKYTFKDESEKFTNCLNKLEEKRL